MDNNQLKVMAYDTLVQIEHLQDNLKKLNAAIAQNNLNAQKVVKNENSSKVEETPSESYIS